MLFSWVCFLAALSVRELSRMSVLLRVAVLRGFPERSLRTMSVDFSWVIFLEGGVAAGVFDLMLRAFDR